MRYDIDGCNWSNSNSNNRSNTDNTSEGDTDDGVEDWVIVQNKK